MRESILSLRAEINAPQTISEKKLSFPRRRESKAYRRGTKSAINYVHLLIYLRGKNLTLKKRLEFYREEVAVCSVVKAELFYGSMKSAYPEKNLRLQAAFLAQ